MRCGSEITCRRCGAAKQRAEFAIRSDGNPHSWCRPCKRGYDRAVSAEKRGTGSDKSPAPKRHNVVRPGANLAAAQQRSETVRQKTAPVAKRAAAAVLVRPYRTCQWLEGVARLRQFCGAAAVPGHSWCGAHCQRAYKPREHDAAGGAP